ncbi:MAG: response regulator [Burkholderiaceae bacterium]|nr:response regulator [Burkholderiaceae bacterium]
MSSTDPDIPVIRLLCVEDRADDVELIAYALERSDPAHNYVLEHVDDAKGFTAALQHKIDAILCDYNLPQFSPYAALKILAERKNPLPLIVVTQAIGEEAAVNVLRHGASDHVTKDKLGTLPQVIARVMSDRRRMVEQERLTIELDAAYRRLKKLSTRLVAAQERERTIISRELHDVLGQTLTGMVIHLHAARKATDPQAATNFTDTAMQMAQEAVQQVKTLSFSLRPAQLDLLGLEAAIRSALQRLADPAGIRVTMTTRGTEAEKLSETASVAVRLVQEAVTNTLRHAGASRIWVRVRFLPLDRIALVFADNGKGFDKNEILDGQFSEKNLGLYGMIERTELAGGRLAIRTRPGAGVIIRAVL